MVKKELGLRERRRIYEDAIAVVAQNQKMAESAAAKERVVKNMIEKQRTKCTAILATTLGYYETVVEIDGEKVTMLTTIDDNNDYAIEKKKFDELVQKLPGDKELREAIWKACVKRDQKATDKFTQLIA